jgi:hypothetical protein
MQKNICTTDVKTSSEKILFFSSSFTSVYPSLFFIRDLMTKTYLKEKKKGKKKSKGR